MDVGDLFKEVDGKLEKIKKTEFDSEETMHRLIENNLEIIFTHLKFLGREVPIDKFRIDTLAWNNKDDPSFTIIEYKKSEKAGVIEQSLCYYALLQKYRDQFLKKYRSEIDLDNLDDESIGDPEIIIIVKELTEHQKKAFSVISAEDAFKKMHIYIIEKHNKNYIYLKEIKPDSDIYERTKNTIKEYKTFDQFILAGNEEIQKLCKILRDKANTKFKNIVCDKPQKKYIPFDICNKRICTIKIQKSNILIRYRAKLSDEIFPPDYMKNHPNKSLGAIIRNNHETTTINDIDEAIQNMEKICIHKGLTDFINE